MPQPIDRNAPVLYEGQGYRIEQTELFAQWLRGLRDRVGQKRIVDRIRRMADGNFGDAKSVGEGVLELRLHFGPGYRVYFAIRDGELVLLLAGGDKDSQARDIAKAHVLMAELTGDGVEDDQL